MRTFEEISWYYFEMYLFSLNILFIDKSALLLQEFDISLWQTFLYWILYSLLWFMFEFQTNLKDVWMRILKRDHAIKSKSLIKRTWTASRFVRLFLFLYFFYNFCFCTTVCLLLLFLHCLLLLFSVKDKAYICRSSNLCI